MKFCPEAMSTLSMMVEEAEMDYMLIAESNHCGTRRQVLSTEVMDDAHDDVLHRADWPPMTAQSGHL